MASTTRYKPTHVTCSAFSRFANPDEDWTKILDLAERRRVQNRIAQRNYRKKLKRRLEDLQRRVGPASTSPPQTHAEIQQPFRTSEMEHFGTSLDSNRQQQPSPMEPPSHYAPLMDDHQMMFSRGFDRKGSRIPPGVAYNRYLAPKEVLYPPYEQSPSQPYRPTMTDAEYENYITPMPITSPSMIHCQEAIKWEGDDTMNPYNICKNGTLPAIDLHSHSYEESNLQVSRSFSPISISASAPSSVAAGAFRTNCNNLFEGTSNLSYCCEHLVYYSQLCGGQYPSTR